MEKTIESEKNGNFFSENCIKIFSIVTGNLGVENFIALTLFEHIARILNGINIRTF